MNIVLAAGYATAPRFMEPLERYWRACWEGLPTETKFIYAHPYGDWERPPWKQLRELRHDVFRERGRGFVSIGGVRLSAQLRSECQEGPILVVGHSGGGVAAMHFAALWEDEDECFRRKCRLVFVGSPRCKVPDAWKASTLYLYSWQSGTGKRDPVTRIGSWGGWVRKGGRWPQVRWNANRFSPGEVIGLPLAGSHADYFRDYPPYVNQEGRSNLELVAEAVRLWFVRNEADQLVQPSLF